MPKPIGYLALTRQATERFYNHGPYECRSCGMQFDFLDREDYKKHLYMRVCRPPRKKLPEQYKLF